MKQIKVFAILFVAVYALSSCSSYSYTSRSTMVDRVNIQESAMIVDVTPDFSKRIVTESARCKTLAEARDEAKYLAVTANKCDVIVDPVFKVEKRGFRYKVYLTGFAGFYQNPRTIYEDINLLKDIKKEDLEKYLILRDPSIIGLMNPQSHSEVINIFDGKAPEVAPAPAPAPAKKADQPKPKVVEEKPQPRVVEEKPKNPAPAQNSSNRRRRR